MAAVITLGFFEQADINLPPETAEGAVNARFGFHAPWHASWEPGNWFVLRANSPPWVYAQTDPEDQETRFAEDGDHILLFPQDRDGLCPRAWLDAAWPFLEHFRSNFSFWPQEAFVYKKVTLVGPPVGTRLGIRTEIEQALKEADFRAVERIWFSSSDKLAGILQKRIDEGVRFRGQDEGQGVPIREAS